MLRVVCNTRSYGIASVSTETSIYNALGQRVKISGGAAGTVLYSYDEGGHLLGEYDATGTLIEETVWLGDTPVATLRPSGATVSIFYVHSDQLNTPRQVTRPSDNTPMWTWNSDPFGTDAANPNPAGMGTFAYNLRFPGQIFDGQAGLHYNMARDYDTAAGRYVESDPTGLRGGINPYAYAKDRPDMLIDPSGLFSMSENVTHHYMHVIPGNRPGQAAGTDAQIDVQCTCSQCGGKWKLTGCHGTLNIDVALLKKLAGSAGEAEFWKEEGDHVGDVLFGANRLQGAGQRAENDLREDRFGSQEECERRTGSYVTGAVFPVLSDIRKESGAKWDWKPFGPHVHWDLLKFFGF